MASVFESAFVDLSPQWTVNPNLLKCVLISLLPVSMSLLDRNRNAASSTKNFKVALQGEQGT